MCKALTGPLAEEGGGGPRVTAAQSPRSDGYLSKTGTRSPRKVANVALEGGALGEISGAFTFGWNFKVERKVKLFFYHFELSIGGL